MSSISAVTSVAQHVTPPVSPSRKPADNDKATETTEAKALPPSEPARKVSITV